MVWVSLEEQLSNGTERGGVGECDGRADALEISERRLRAQKDALQAGMSGASLGEALAILAGMVSAEMKGEARTAFFVVDAETDRLHPVRGAGDMADAYLDRVDELAAGTDCLGCGRGTGNVSGDPVWRPWGDAAEEFGYRGCWCFPIGSREGRPAGALAMYLRDAREAGSHDVGLAEAVTATAGVLMGHFAEAQARARGEAALREGEKRYRSLFDRIDEGFCIIEMIFEGQKAVDYRFLEVNPAFERYTGLANAQGRRIREIAPEHGEHWFDEYGGVALTGQAIRFEAPAKAPGDRWYDLNVFPVGEPKQRRVAVVFSDITERTRVEQVKRESEEQQRLIVELVPALLWWADPPGQRVTTNKRWQTYTGQRELEIPASGWLDSIHPEDAGATRADLEFSYETGEPLELQRRIRRVDGEYRWHLVRQVPVRNGAGAITRWFGAAIDVHESHELQGRQEMLVGELQHRTRNLLGVIRSMAERTGETSHDIASFRERFRDRLEALARVQGLLSRLEETGRICFDELIKTELAAMEGAAERVILDGPPGIRLRSSMVQTLAMALHELATNAVKYGALGQHEGRLAIRWWMGPPDVRHRPWLHIDWRESGVRMPPTHSAPTGTGQGRELIEKALPYQLSADTRFELGPDGVHCTISIPVSQSNMRQEDGYV